MDLLFPLGQAIGQMLGETTVLATCYRKQRPSVPLASTLCEHPLRVPPAYLQCTSSVPSAYLQRPSPLFDRDLAQSHFHLLSLLFHFPVQRVTSSSIPISPSRLQTSFVLCISRNQFNLFFSLFSLPSLAFAFFLSWLPLLCNPLAWGAERRGFLPNNGHHRKLGPIVPSGSRLPLLPLYLPFLYSYCTTHHHQTNIAHPSLPGESKLTTQRPALDHGWTFFFFFLFFLCHANPPTMTVQDRRIVSVSGFYISIL